MIEPRDDSMELDHDTLLPGEDERLGLSDDYGWSPESETPIEDDD